MEESRWIPSNVCLPSEQASVNWAEAQRRQLADSCHCLGLSWLTARVSSGAPSSLEAAAACFWPDKPQFPYTLSFAMHSRSKSLPFQSMVVFPGRPRTLRLAQVSRLAYFLSDFLVYFLSDFAPILHQLQQSKSQLTMVWMCTAPDTIENTTQCKKFQLRNPPNFRRIMSLLWKITDW